jgi:hypothetical protein
VRRFVIILYGLRLSWVELELIVLDTFGAVGRRVVVTLSLCKAVYSGARYILLAVSMANGNLHREQAPRLSFNSYVYSVLHPRSLRLASSCHLSVLFLDSMLVLILLSLVVYRRREALCDCESSETDESLLKLTSTATGNVVLTAEAVCYHVDYLTVP